MKKKLDNSDKIIKEYEDYIGDNKNRNVILDKVGGYIVKEICSEKDGVYKSNSINRFFKISNNNKREMLSNNYFIEKKTINNLLL